MTKAVEMIRAIPTSFAGINFRSRLEARWAAFFARIGWVYTYEPFDGNHYSPDFLIHNGKRPLLVEVKPAVTADDYFTALPKVHDGLLDWEYDYVILGAKPYIESEFINTTAGLYMNNSWWDGTGTRRPTRPGCEGHRHRAAAATWWIRGGSQLYLKPSFTRGGVVRGPQVSVPEVDQIWRGAGNDVQWKKATSAMSTAEKTQARIQQAQAKRRFNKG